MNTDDQGLKPLPFTSEQIWTLPLDDLLGPDWRDQVQRMVAALRDMETRPMAKRRPHYALTVGARADGVTIAPSTEPARCEWCGIAMTLAIGERPADDQIRVPGLPWPVCVRCGRERGLVVTDE